MTSGLLPQHQHARFPGTLGMTFHQVFKQVRVNLYPLRGLNIKLTISLLLLPWLGALVLHGPFHVGAQLVGGV